MSARGVRRFVEDLLGNHRPRPVPVDNDDDEALLRTAIELRAGRPGTGAPSEEFISNLHRTLAAEMAAPESGVAPAPGPAHTRRQMMRTASIAAAAAAVGGGVGAAVVGVTVNHDTEGSPQAGTLSPDTGAWRAVLDSADLPEGTVRRIDTGSVTGFVHRRRGRLMAVSGACTHLGCQLRLDVQNELACPCHRAAFAVTGELLHHELKVAPAPLPHLLVREVDGQVQVYVPSA